MEESPILIKCHGCERNIKRNKDNNECLIYLENDSSRLIRKRIKDQGIKPYETLGNIIEKNKCVKLYNEEDIKDARFNERIELLDSLIDAEIEFIEILKNSIYCEKEEGERRRKKGVWKREI